MIKSFEGARGIAAIFVVLYHLLYRSQLSIAYFSPIHNGYLFVDLFFVLSGFVICSAYSEKIKKLDEFLPFIIRRFGRLFPLLAFSTLLFVIAQNSKIMIKDLIISFGFSSYWHFQNLSTDYVIPTFSALLSTLTLTHGMGIFNNVIINYASWSISTEFYSYLLFILICFFLQSRIRLAFFGLVSITGFVMVIWVSIYLHNCLTQYKCLDVTSDFGFARCIASFFLGALTYYWNKKINFNANKLQLIILTLIISLFYFINIFPVMTFLFPILFCIFVLSICRDTGFFSIFLNTKKLQILGQRSYSVYMLHPVLLFFLGNFLTENKNSSYLIYFIFFVVLIIISGWTYRLIEEPSRSFFNRIAIRQKQSLIVTN